MAEILGNHLACPICHEWLLASHTLSCGHMFCGLCLASWLPHKQSCPTCRKAIAGEAGCAGACCFTRPSLACGDEFVPA